MKKVFRLFALIAIVNFGFIACEPNTTSDAGDDNIFENTTGTEDDQGEYIEPDVVHVLIDGKIVRSGGKELAIELEEKGYGWLES